MNLAGSGLYRRLILRNWLRHPLLAALNILSIALGVTVFAAVQMANRGAVDSFQSTINMVAGRADLEIRGDLDDAILPRVAAVPGVLEAVPLVEGIVTLPGKPGEYLRILGLDPLAGQDLRTFRIRMRSGADFDIGAWLGGAQAVAVSGKFLASIPLAGDGSFAAIANDRAVRLSPAFVISPEDTLAPFDPRLAMMDIGWAQELFGQAGRLTSILVRLDHPEDAASVESALRKIVPADVSVAPPATRGAQTAMMLSAFGLNLTALSLVSMVVGAFLIYNSLSATVVRRTREIGVLRAVGMSRGEVFSIFLAEAFVSGVAGTILGLLAAAPLAQLLSAPVEKTISALYDPTRIGHVALGAGQFAAAVALGVGVSLLAAWKPAAECAGVRPALIFHPGAAVGQLRRRSWRLPGFGALCLAGALATSWGALHGGGKYLGFAAVVLLLVGFSCFVPAVAIAFCSLFRGPVLLRLAAQNLVRSLHRSAVTIAALAVAVAMTVSVSVMIYSFRGSVNDWVSHTLIADLFIAPTANEITGLQSFLPPGIIAWAESNPAVQAVGTFRELPVEYAGRSVSLDVVEGNARGELMFLSGGADALQSLARPDHIAVTESFATRFGVRAGQTLTLATPVGDKSFTIASIYRDYTRDEGIILMPRKNFDVYWHDDRIHSLAVKLRDGADSARFADECRARFGAGGAISVYENADLRSRVMRIFDQTFAVTYVLRDIAVVVAVAGVFLSLVTLVTEREREIGVLRSLGASALQIALLHLAEAALIGILAAIFGIASGSCMALILTWVINQAFFGWSIALAFPLATLASTPLWLLPAALVAALLPALRAARIQPATAVRFE